MDATTKSATSGTVNYLEIELRSIDNIPPAWTTAENGTAPMFAEHPFRYDVELVGLPISDAESAQFSNGRLLQKIPLYADFVATAPRSRETRGEEDEDVPTAPGDPPPPPPGSARPATEPSKAGGAPASILFVLTPQAEATEIKEEVPVVQKKDPRNKKHVPAPVPQTLEPTKPLAPEKDQLPPFQIRIPLHADILAAVELLVEKSQCLTLVLSRRLKPNVPAEWEDVHESRFRAHIRVPLKPLLSPGATAFETTVRVEPIEPELKEEEKGKKKPPPKKSKTNIPALLTDEPETGDNHPYILYNTTATVTVFCRSAITRLPQSRPMPTMKPTDLIPKRVRPARRPLEASKQFVKEVGLLAERIVSEYREHATAVNMEGDDARNSFLAYLQASGHALSYQRLLSPIVQSVVKERFVKKSEASQADLQLIVNELYSYLLEQLHVALDRIFGARADQVTSASLDGDDDSRWQRLALEAEIMKEPAVAVRYFQERLGQANNPENLPDIWCDYAEYSLRIRDVLRAEQSFREALALDSTHARSLISYGLLLISRNRIREAEVLLQSAADVVGSALSWGAVALLWDVLVMTMTDAESAEVIGAYARESKLAIRQALHTEDAPMSPEDVYTAVGKRLVELHLEDLANFSLAKIATPTFEVDYLYAQLFFQADQLDEAADLLNNVVSSGVCSGVQECRARILLGDVYTAADRPVEAEQAYDAALRIDPNCAPSASLIRLGNIYISLGRFKDALATFLVAAQQWPSGLTWLGVGIAYLRLEDLGRAEQALNESNVLNNLSPKTWAYLALLCLRQRRDKDAEGAYNQAVKLGLSDAQLIAEVGSEYFRSGYHAVAEASFRRALGFQDDPTIRMHLARALATMRRYGDARTQFAIVAESGSSEYQRVKAAEQMELLPTTEN